MSSSSQPPSNFSDVRMRGFAQRTPVADVIEWLENNVTPVGTESIELTEGAGRVLAEPITSSVNVPGFHRGMMDGFAVQAADTAGASSYNPLPLHVIGESLPGAPFEGQAGKGEAVRIMTGAPLPTGSDTVLPVELTQVRENEVLVIEQVAEGKNVGQPGEDIQAGEVVLAAGRCLRPQDVGVLSSMGIAQLSVVTKVRVRILVTGDELLSPGSAPHGCFITDANSPMLSALVCRDGGIPENPGIVPDDPAEILKALHSDVDVVLVSGGTSVGQEDHAPLLVAEHGELAIHGIAMRPSSPTGIGRIGDRLIFLLPGNPVSCLCAYDFFAGRAIRVMAGYRPQWPYSTLRLPLRHKLVSTIGRVDYSRVRIVDDQVEPLAIGGASILSSTTRSDGFVIVPQDSEGFPDGSEVDVFLYDSLVTGN
jgi:molybdopterin molybdotransferase